MINFKLTVRYNYVNTGFASALVLLILSLLSLFSLSLFRTGINSQFVIRNEIASLKSFYRAQDVLEEMAEVVYNMDTSLVLKAITKQSICYPWLKTEKEIDLSQISNSSYWRQFSPKKFPPDAEAITVFLNSTQTKISSESLVMTHGKGIKTFRFSIIAKAEVDGGLAIVEMGISRKILQ